MFLAKTALAMFYNHFKLICLSIFVIAGQSSLTIAEILLVPAEYRLISSAIESTNEGDTILVSPGNYRDAVIVRSNITIGSLYLVTGDTAYVNSTIIRGTGNRSVFEVIGPYSPHIVGFRILGGYVSYGGGIATRGNATPTIKQCIITECGSGISAIDGAAPSIDNCRILNNGRGNAGDGIYCRNDAEPIVTNTLIAGNHGSGLYCRNNSNATLENCVIERNRAQGVHLINSSPTLLNCLILENSDDIVGGVYLRSGSDAELINCTISGNIGDAFGGIVCYQSDPILLDCRIVDNTGGSVGGIKCSFGSAPSFVNCLIRGNIGIRQRGGIYGDNSQPTFINCEISDNISGEGCAGITLNESISQFVKCLIYDHHSVGEGGAFHITDSDLTIMNCTIVRNSTDDAGAIYFEGDGTLELTNSILWYNPTPNIYLNRGGNQDQGETILNVSYSDIEEGRESVAVHGEVFLNWDKGNIDADPLFVDPENEEFQLSEQSPCIDAGSPYTPYDRDGTISDMGALYYTQANIRISADSLIFNDIYSGQIDSLSLDISNLGEALLIVQNLQITPGRTPFVISAPPTPHNIAPDETRRYWVRFEPHNYGRYRAILFIESSDRRQGQYMVFISGESLNAPGTGLNQPTEFSIRQVYPNPFNSNPTLSFYTPLQQAVSVDLTDLNGRLVYAFQPRLFSAGSHALRLPMDDVKSGTYLVRIMSPQSEYTQKIVSIR